MIKYENIKLESPFAVISDIHENSWSLEADLEDIERRNIETVFNLGDIFYGPLDPAGTASILRRMNIATVCGNEDRIIFENSQPSSTLHYVRSELSLNEFNWLKSLKMEQTISDEIFLCHGTPESDRQYLIYAVQPGGLIMRCQKEMERILSNRTESLVLCGHDHLPNVIKLNAQQVIVNPGSVGLPAYTDDTPYEHYVENGSPHAKYCIIDKLESGWLIEHKNIPYDFATASDMAKKNGREDWAYWLKTGRAK